MKKRILFYLLLLFFLSPYLVFAYMQNLTLAVSLFGLLLKFLQFALIVEVLIVLTGHKVTKTLFLLALLPTFLVDFINLYLFGDFITTAGALSLFNTTQDEVIGFTQRLLWLCISLVLAYFIVAYLFYKLKFESVKLTGAQKGKKAFLLIASFVIVMVIELVFVKNTDPNGRNYFVNAKRCFVKQYPVNFYYRVYEKLLYDYKMEKSLELMSDFSFGAKQLHPTMEPEAYVFIIGETQRSDLYMKVLMDHVDDFPGMRDSSLVLFDNFLSTANATAYSVPLMLTRATASDYLRAFREKSILGAFKEADFKTYWICNQNLFKGVGASLYRSEIDSFIPLYKENASDTILVDALKGVMEAPRSKKFIVLNLKGNHYNEYPDSFNIYKPNVESEGGAVLSRENAQLYLNSYNNTTLFQLSVMERLLGEIKSKGGVSGVFFVSDHGESLFEPPHYLYGHGSSTIPKEQLHVFAYSWFSAGYIDRFPDKYKSAKINSKKTITFDQLFYSLLGIGDIGYDGFPSDMSFVDSLYKAPEGVDVTVNGATVHFPY